MQAIAKWLLARPHNAVLALALTLILPAPQLTSGAVMVLLVLAQGPRFAVIEASVAAALLVVMSLLLGGSLASVIGLTAGTWVPVLLLAILLVTMRSLTLTLQVSVIVAVAALLLFQVAVPDPAAFWQPYLDAMVAIVRENGLELDTELLTAEVMTISAVLVFWMLFTGALLLGYGLYRRLPVETVNYGLVSGFEFRARDCVHFGAGFIAGVCDRRDLATERCVHCVRDVHDAGIGNCALAAQRRNIAECCSSFGICIVAVSAGFAGNGAGTDWIYGRMVWFPASI